MPLGIEVGLGPGHVVLDGDPAPSPPKSGISPQFSAHVYCDETTEWIKVPPKRHCVRWGPSSPLPEIGQTPKSAAHVYCGQAAAWIKMQLGTIIGLGPGNIVLDADPAPPPKWHSSPPQISAHVVAKRLDGWIHATCHEGGPRPGPHCVTWGPSSPLTKGAQRPIFGQCLLWSNGRPSQLLMSNWPFPWVIWTTSNT